MTYADRLRTVEAAIGRWDHARRAGRPQTDPAARAALAAARTIWAVRRRIRDDELEPAPADACERCNGTGQYGGHGACFRCHGTGRA